MQVLTDSTDNSILIRVVDYDGRPITSLTHATSGLQPWYRRDGGLVVNFSAASLAALDSAHTDGGFKHVSNGYYRLDVPDAAFAGGADSVAVGVDCSSVNHILIAANVSLYDVTNRHRCCLELANTTSEGLEVRLTAWLENDGQYVPLTVASIEVAVREHGAGADLFVLTSSTVTNGRFELSQSSPGFTDDRLYTATVTITVGAASYVSVHTFPVMG